VLREKRTEMTLKSATGTSMKPKQAEIIRQSTSLFNREGYQSPSIDRISENAGIS